jgi:hypothetical protein
LRAQFGAGTLSSAVSIAERAEVDASKSKDRRALLRVITIVPLVLHGAFHLVLLVDALLSTFWVASGGLVVTGLFAVLVATTVVSEANVRSEPFGRWPWTIRLVSGLLLYPALLLPAAMLLMRAMNFPE